METSGKSLDVGLDARVLTEGGNWLLDPATLNIVSTGGDGVNSVNASTTPALEQGFAIANADVALANAAASLAAGERVSAG